MLTVNRKHDMEGNVANVILELDMEKRKKLPNISSANHVVLSICQVRISLRMRERHGRLSCLILTL
jgi:hypothetical protein